MKINLFRVYLFLVGGGFLSTLSLGHYFENGNLELNKREIDPLISPQQDPQLVSSYQASEIYSVPTISEGLVSPASIESEEILSAHTNEEAHVNALANDFNYLDDSVEEDEPCDDDEESEDDEDSETKSPLKKIKSILKLDTMESSTDIITESFNNSDEVIIDSELPNAAIMGLYDYDEEDDCSEEDENDYERTRGDTIESENGKTIPDYFDPDMGDGDIPCNDDYQYLRTREGDDKYHDTHVVSKLDDEGYHEHDSNGRYLDVKRDETEMILPAEYVTSDPAEAIPFPKVKLYEAASQVKMDPKKVQMVTRDSHESGASSISTVPAFLSIILCSLIVIFDNI